MKDIQMPPEYGAIHPQEGDTVADAPAGYVTLFADFFGVCNILLPLTVFVVEVLERFYQMTVSMGFFSFRQREGSPKLMTPPKGLTKWKTKFFYVKVAAITAKLQLRNVTDTIISENISLLKADTVHWFSDLRLIGWKKLSNSQLWVLRMMLGRMNRKVRPVVREKSGEDAPLWRMFDPGFKRKVEVIAYADDEDGFNVTIRDNFRVPSEAALAVELPHGKGSLGALGDPDGTGVPKQCMETYGEKKLRGGKKPHESVVIPNTTFTQIRRLRGSV
ncbi:hypothetical protein Hanom_Chr05g00412091 [Helianthus anomalus]